MAEDEKRGSAGPATDRNNSPVIDPTANVKDLVVAGMERQDDLRHAQELLFTAQLKRQDDLRTLEAAHNREIIRLEAEHQRELRVAESARIDAIRNVDVQAVARAAEVSQQAAAALQVQTGALAETLRNQLAATAAASLTNLQTALAPITKDITELRAAQYTQQGQKAEKTEGQGTNQYIITTLIALGALVLYYLATHASTIHP